MGRTQYCTYTTPFVPPRQRQVWAREKRPCDYRCRWPSPVVDSGPNGHRFWVPGRAREAAGAGWPATRDRRRLSCFRAPSARFAASGDERPVTEHPSCIRTSARGPPSDPAPSRRLPSPIRRSRNDDAQRQLSTDRPPPCGSPRVRTAVGQPQPRGRPAKVRPYPALPPSPGMAPRSPGSEPLARSESDWPPQPVRPHRPT